jgi:hypothetical protein
MVRFTRLDMGFREAADSISSVCLVTGPGNIPIGSLTHDLHQRTLRDIASPVCRVRPGGHSGTTLHSSVTDLTPDIGSSDKPLPGPATNQPKPALPAVY